MFCTTDFAENVVAHRKYELAEQHFHKIEILLFGAVLSFVEKDENEEMTMHQYSYMISSDYRYYLTIIKKNSCKNVPSITRVKDCVLVYAAFDIVLECALPVAASLGLTIKSIIHKVVILLVLITENIPSSLRVTGLAPSTGTVVWWLGTEIWPRNITSPSPTSRSKLAITK